METHVRQVGEEVISQFPIFDTDGVSYLSGVASGDFEVTQLRDDLEVSATATVSEIGSSGIYRVSFTPTSRAQWAVVVKLPSTGDVWGMLVVAYDVLSRDIAEAQMNVAYDEDTSMLYMEVWLDRGGQSVQAAKLVACSVTVYDSSGLALFIETSSSPKADGHFSLSHSVPLTDNKPYNAAVSIVDSVGSVSTSQAFTTVG